MFSGDYFGNTRSEKGQRDGSSGGIRERWPEAPVGLRSEKGQEYAHELEPGSKETGNDSQPPPVCWRQISDLGFTAII